MKRILTIGLMLASALALTNCTEEIVDPNAQQETAPGTETTDQPQTGIPFQVYASLGADTKTEGYIEENTLKLKTRWSKGDKITVFYAPVDAEGTEGTLNIASGTFAVSDIETGKFDGFLPSGFDQTKTYNWYFVYGASSADANKETAVVNIGYNSNTIAEGSVEHVGGINCPMYGSAYKLSGTITPVVQMRHLANLMEVNVINNTNKNPTSKAKPGDLVIYDVGLTYGTDGNWPKTEALTGDFTLNVTTGTLTKTNNSKNTVTSAINSAPITIRSTNDTAKEKEGMPTSATFYFVTAPLELQTSKTYAYYCKYNTSGAISEVITVDEYNNLPDEVKDEYQIGTNASVKIYKNKNDANDIITEAQYNDLTDEEKGSYELMTIALYRYDAFSFTVNGSARPIGDSKEYDMLSGNVHRFNLPVKEMKCPFYSDGLNVTSKGRMAGDAEITVATLGNFEQKKFTINGHECDSVYVLGKTGTATYKEIIEKDEDGNVTNKYTILDPDNEVNQNCQGTITIRGFLKDMINALPVGFYAARYNNLPTAMTIEKIDFKLPVYKGIEVAGHGWKEFNNLRSRYKFSETLGSVFGAIGWDLSNGITREFITQKLGVDANTITFSGLVGNGYYDREEGNVVVMYEDPVYKFMSDADDGNVQSYVSKFNYSSYTATLDGLRDILNATDYVKGDGMFADTTIKWSDTARKTGNAIYNRIFNLILDKANGIVGTENAPDIVELAFETLGVKDADALMHFLRDMEFEIVIKTYPHPSTPNTFNPMVVWGMDAKGPDVIVPAPTTTTTE